MSGNTTDFEKGFKLILETFQKYARSGDDGCADKLEIGEMKDLIKNEFKDYLALGENISVDELFQQFDEDNSDSVDFVEFLKVVAELAAKADILSKIAAEAS